MRHKAFPPGWSFTIHRGTRLFTRDPATGQWDLPAGTGVWVEYYGPDGYERGTPTFPDGHDEAALRAAIKMAHRVAAGKPAQHRRVLEATGAI